MKICIAVLTRGYTDALEYSTLIQRNDAIARFLDDKTIPLLFFHEGNITEEQQLQIKVETPELIMQFIDVAENDRAFRKEKQKIPHLRGNYENYFGLGYRHMCHFWFVDFWSFLADYDIVIRIDEDCVMESSIDSIIHKMKDPSSTASIWSGMSDIDKDFVCYGLNQFTLQFMKENTTNNPPVKYPPSGPYTNFLGLRLDRIRNNRLLMMYIEEISKSNYIYLYRWGDLPLWGEAITYILGNDSLVIDKEIRYYHGTHYIHVNEIKTT